jgi:O-methyltransferase involved in polyketide biosynthesis
MKGYTRLRCIKYRGDVYMEQKSMTALVSAFSRAYHSENNDVKIFNDSVARLLLSEQE